MTDVSNLEKHLLKYLSEDCASMPCDRNSEREKGFFTCAGSMFAILEQNGLTTMSGHGFIKALDASVKLQSIPKRNGANDD